MTDADLDQLAEAVATKLAEKLSPKEWLNTEEAARHLGTSTQFLEIGRSKGTGPSYCKAGRMVRYHRDDLNQYLLAGRQGGGQ